MVDERRSPEPPDPEVDVEEEEAGGDGARRFVTDAVRKAFLAGVGAIFLTEEGARKLARDWKLPKEVLGFVTAQAAGAKDEVLRVVSDEVRKFFESEALRREFVKLIGSMSIEITAEIRLKESGGKPKVHLHKVKPRFGKKESEGDAEPRPEPDAEA
jgi:hypothetical protein